MAYPLHTTNKTAVYSVSASPFADKSPEEGDENRAIQASLLRLRFTTSRLQNKQVRRTVLEKLLALEKEEAGASRLQEDKQAAGCAGARPAPADDLAPFRRVTKRRRADGTKITGTCWADGGSRAGKIQGLLGPKSAAQNAFTVSMEHDYCGGPSPAPPAPVQTSPRPRPGGKLIGA